MPRLELCLALLSFFKFCLLFSQWERLTLFGSEQTSLAIWSSSVKTSWRTDEHEQTDQGTYKTVWLKIIVFRLHTMQRFIYQLQYLSSVCIFMSKIAAVLSKRDFSTVYKNLYFKRENSQVSVRTWYKKFGEVGSNDHALFTCWKILSPPKRINKTFISFLVKKRVKALWSITAKNTDWSTGPLARPFARGKVNDWIAVLSVFFSIFDYSE